MASCSFCGIDQDKARVLVAGPRANVCDECLKLGLALLHDREGDAPPPLARATAARVPARSADSAYRCSFCDRPRREVRMLMAGPHDYICDGCIQVAIDTSARANDER